MRIISRVLDILRAMDGIDNVIYDGPASANVRLDRKNGLTALVYQLPSFEINVEASAKMESAAVQIAFLRKGRIDADGEETDAILDTIYPVLCDFIAALDEDRTIRQTNRFKVKPTYGEFDAFMVGYSVELELSDRGFSCLDTSENPVRILNVDENGTYDVTHYGKVDVNVASPEPEWPEYLRITAIEPSTVKNGGASVMKSLSVEYSKNGGEWRRLEGQTVSLDAGEYAEFRSSEYGLYFGGNSWRFSITGKTHLSGNIRSMLNKSLNGKIPTYALAYLFQDCTGICSVDEHFLEGSIPGIHSFNHTFYGCSNMVNSPILPDVLDESCFTYMFGYCTSLTKAVLPAREGKTGCYQFMFYGCSGFNEVTCYLDEIGLNCAQWLTRTSPTGVVKCPSTTIIASLPSGWVREDI